MKNLLVLFVMSLMVASCGGIGTNPAPSEPGQTYGPCVLQVEVEVAEGEEKPEKFCKYGDWYNVGAAKCSSSQAKCLTKKP